MVLAIVFTVLIAAYTKQLYKKAHKKGIQSYLQNGLDQWDRQITNVFSKRDESHGYVAALSFNGQQGAGIQSLMSLQCWAASFKLPIHILEPIMSKTTFVSFPPAKSTNRSNTFMRFSDFFDIQHFNRMSESIGYPPLGEREEFFTTAPRDVVFIDIKSVPKNTSLGQRAARVVWTAESEPDHKEHYCYQFKENSQLQQLAKENFCVVRIVEATHSLANHYIFSDKEVREVIFGNRLPKRVTVVFSMWRTPWYVANNELDNPLICKGAGYGSSKDQFLPSPRLLLDAKYYETRFLSSSNEVAVMLRIEHMIEFVDQHKHSTVDDCLVEAFRLTKEMQRSGQPMVTMDVGKFGSGYWTTLVHKRGVDIEKLTEKSKLLLTSLFDDKRSFEEWEESFTQASRGVENSGYIAALQRTLASRAKCLVLVGGGTFQDLAVKDYMKNHPNKEDQCVHFVCVKNKESLGKTVHH